ncbi:YcaO-like family protein [Pseudoxanthobacter sp. M-2]|uniref:YcaO-like family protein n=1 Tax=Pseudoxanthobacter sp. M-2 TaxID=3078754 RepID=UPI0038FC7F45
MTTARRPGWTGLFEVVDLPDTGGPVRCAVALPGERLRALPGFPVAATPEAGRLASGRGLTVAAARRSALGEAAELVSACAWGDEAVVTATMAAIGPAALAPAALTGFTARQLAAREAWNARHAGFDWQPPPFDESRAIGWIEVTDAFGGPPAFAPADAVLIGRREAGDADAVAIGDSSGCAAGETVEAATLAAVLELIERDATGRWWYGGRRRSPVTPEAAELPAALARFLTERARRTVLFDITTDIGIPVVVAVSAEADGADVALGFAARLDASAAACAAATEMLQMEVALEAARELGRDAADWWTWRRRVAMALPPLDAANRLPAARLAGGRRDGGRSHDGLGAVLEALDRAAIPLWTVDLTRPAIGVPVVRALSTALCHAKPRFARRRLGSADPRDVERVAVGRERRVPLLV